MLDLGPQFAPEAGYLDELLARRDEFNERKVSFGCTFLDDCLGGIYPDDLVLIAAATGVGKTALACNVALSAAKAELDPVYMFALEAEPGEISARVGFSELARLTSRRMDFAGWWRGDYKEEDEKLWPKVKAGLVSFLSRLRTLYKGRGDFTNLNLSQRLEAIADDAKLVVLDHLHVVDSEGSGDLGVQRKTVRLLRDFALDASIPVVAISHLRKKNSYERNLIMPEIDDLHGSSELSKIATGVVLVAREWDGPRPKPYLSSTLMRVAKDRRGRASGLVARTYYDLSKAEYVPEYRLGRLMYDKELRRQAWKPIAPDKVPEWAINEVSKTNDRPF